MPHFLYQNKNQSNIKPVKQSKGIKLRRINSFDQIKTIETIDISVSNIPKTVTKSVPV